MARPSEVFSAAVLDRSAATRKDEALLSDLLAAPGTLLVPVWRGKSFVCARAGAPRPATITVEDGRALLGRGGQIVWLGRIGKAACFALDVSAIDDPGGHDLLGPLGAPGDLRFVAAATPAGQLEVLLTARAMLSWHRSARFCARCGEAMRSLEGGWMRQCTGCKNQIFPRTDPAVMVLVTRGDHCVLARQPGFPAGMWSALAGFVEPGESLEACVHRETREEVGLVLDRIQYFGSQPWPFPRSLMLGFFAETRQTQLTVDRAELEAARWVTRQELARPEGFWIPPAISLAHELITAFANGSGSAQ